MAKRYSLLSFGSGIELLHFLSDLTQKVSLRSLPDPHLRIDSSNQKLLLIVENTAQDRNREISTAFKILSTSYLESTGYDPSVDDKPGVGSPLNEAIIGLFWSSLKTRADAIFPQDAKEFLLVSKEPIEPQAARQFEQLTFHPTKTRWLFSPPYRITQVLHDLDRVSTFPSLIAADCLPDIHLCVSNNSLAGKKFFLPFQIAISDQLLAYLSRLIENAPEWFGLPGQSAQRSGVLVLLGTTDRMAQGMSATLIHFFESDLIDGSEIAPSPQNLINAQILNLTNSREAMQNLQTAIAESEPCVGYELALYNTKASEEIEIERQRLEEKKQEIEWRLAEIEEMTQTRPILLRFTQAQLPALADVLRRLPEKLLGADPTKERMNHRPAVPNQPRRLLQQDCLLYGHQYNREHPSGLHFLCIPPQLASRVELYPLLAWEFEGEPAMRYWMDPSWARYYYEGKPDNCLIFTPYGQALFPPMHVWQPDDQSKYVRDLMSKWFHGVGGAQKLPEHPIYLFEKADKVEGGIYISVIDANAFVPLKTRLEWLNTNLTFLDEFDALKVGEFVPLLEKYLLHRIISEEVQASYALSQEEFAQAALRAAEEIAVQTNELTKAVTDRMQAILNESQTTIGQARELNQTVKSIKTAYAQMTHLVEQVEQMQQKVVEDEKSAQNRLADLMKKVDNVIRKANETRQTAENRLDQTLNNLRSRRRELRDMLSRVNPWRD